MLLTTGIEMPRLFVVDALDDDQLKAAWEFHVAAFTELNKYTVQRHLLTLDEFSALATDTRVAKYMCYNGDHLCGLSLYTRDLDSVPLVSSPYFERRWPKHYAEKRIWYVLFVCVNEIGRANGSFSTMVEHMYLAAAKHDGIIALDVCRLNEEVRHLTRTVSLMLHRLAGAVRHERMDEQAYFIYEFPEVGSR